MTMNLETDVFGQSHPVTIEGSVSVEPDVYTRPQAAEFGVWATYSLLGTEPAQQLLRRDQYRSRALITVTQNTPGTGAVWVGTRAQLTGTMLNGGKLASGTFEVKNQQELYLIGDGTNPMTVTVLSERYDAYPDKPLNMGSG